MPGFRDVVEKFLVDSDRLSYEFIGLVAEALGLGNDGLAEFFDPPGQMQHRAKVTGLSDVFFGWALLNAFQSRSLDIRRSRRGSTIKALDPTTTSAF